jgi:hypothetical protein
MRLRLKRTAAVTFATMVSTFATGVATAQADMTNTGTTTGRVCMFDAPRGALSLGHVAWAFRWADGSDTWDYGATLESHNWEKHGSEQQMLHDFATMNESGGYTSYRCKDTAADDQSVAESVATTGFGRPYNLAEDNCLTRSIEIFKAYDDSGGLKGLASGKFTFPNAYFHYAMPGWEDEKAL